MKLWIARISVNPFVYVIMFDKISEWLEAEKIKVKQPQAFPFSNAKEALSLVENRKTQSKIVLEF